MLTGAVVWLLAGGLSVPEVGLADLVRIDSRRTRVGVALGRILDRPTLGSALARVLRAPMRVRFLAARITRFHGWLLRHTGGRLRRSWLFAAGQPVIALTTVGRRTGQLRTTAVACFADGDDVVVAAMNLGQERHPAWALNLMACPEAVISIGGQAVAVHACRAEGEEAERLWRRWTDLQPSATAMRAIARRAIPIFVLRRAS